MRPEIHAVLRQAGAEKDAEKLAVFKAKTNEQLGAHFRRNPVDLEELAFDLFARTWADVMKEDIVPRIIQVKTVKLAEPDYIEEDLRGMKAYWQGKGGLIRSDIIRYERAQMPREEMVAAIDMHADEMATDFWGTFEKLVAQAREKLGQLPTERLLELIQSLLVSGDTFGAFPANGLTDTQIDPIIEEVALRSKGNATLIGTRPALRHLAGIGLDFGNNIAEKVFNTGQIGVYKGYQTLMLENSEDFLGDFVIPNNEIMVVGQNCGRLTYYGDTPKTQILKEKSFMQRWETARDAGLLLYGVEKGRLGRIILT